MAQTLAKVYSLQVSSISCINCAANIKTILKNGLMDPSVKINVNVMNEKVTLTVFKDEVINKAIEILKTTKYQPIGSPLLISGNSQNERNITFVLDQNTQVDKIDEEIRNLNGIIRKDISSGSSNFKINITYDCASIKGRQIGDLIQKYDKSYTVVNQRIDSLRAGKKNIAEQMSLRLTIGLIIYFLLAYMIFPILPSFKSFYLECISFPQNFGIYSISVLFNIGLTIYVMNAYAKPYIYRAYKNYQEYRTTNMQTLIALGSLSAFGLAIFFLVRYTLEELNNTLVHPHMAIMDINHSLTSASIIVLIVTIGKHVEKRVKEKIAKMTDEMFPESVLFHNMDVNYVDVRNRKLVVLGQKIYNVSLIQKDDIIKINQGTLLVDGIVISGKAKVTQSARTGSDQIIVVGKGERIQSGATVHDCEECLVIVQKVIEKSLLIQVVTHVKFSQNQDGQSSAIQTLCKKIANYFVKGVVMLSIFTMLVWTLILYFSLTEVPVCNFCWIIQRGIGVLVASCPCALGLAIPSVIANILNLAIKSGILIKKTSVFQKVKNTKIVTFDKTGTLFTKLNQIESFKYLNRTVNQEQIWQILALLQKDIRHPLAQIIYKEAFNRSKISGTNFSFLIKQKQFLQGRGIIATLVCKSTKQEMKICIGNAYLLKSQNIKLLQKNEEKEEYTTIFIAIDGNAEMVMFMNTHSNLRPQALEVVSKLKEQNMQIHILSGDAEGSVTRLGQNLNIPSQHLHAQKTAIEKVQWVSSQQQSQKDVIMVGDGLNDIPCLKQAAIGISINAKSQLNINAADVVILSQNLHKIVALIRFLKKGNLFIKINLFWAFAYNVIIMPIVAGALFHFDIFVSPIWSAIAMSCSSLLVVTFSHMLTYFHYDDSLIEKKQKEQIMESGVDLSGSNRQVLTLNEQIS